MILYYIRHGDPIYDPDSLTPLGHEQAKALAKRLTMYGLNEIYVSTSNRAKQTAQPTCNALGISPTLCPWAEEGNCWKNYALKCEDGVYRWGFHDDHTIEKFHLQSVRTLGETWYTHPAFRETNYAIGVQETNASVDSFFRTLGLEHERESGRYRIIEKNDKRIALFAHQGFGIAFLSSVLDIPYPLFCTHFDMGHSSMTVINFEERNGYAYAKTLQLSNDSHLYKEGILTGYQNTLDI